MALFNGVSAFPITPADAGGRVETDVLCRLLERLVAAKVQSIGLLGSTGAYMFLTRRERQRAVAAAVECVDGRTPLIVGVGALRTDDAVDLARDAAAAGADGLLLAPVSYTPLTDDEVFQHFVAVAGATDLPLCIYNNPGTTHFTFGTGLLQRLAEVPTIRAVKMPAPGADEVAAALAALRAALPEGFSVGYSGDWGCAGAMLAGADTWYSVAAGLLPEPCLKLAGAAIAGDASETRRINDLFQPIWDLFQEFGGFRVVYAIAQVLDLADCTPPRPVLPVSDADRARVAEAVERLGDV